MEYTLKNFQENFVYWTSKNSQIKTYDVLTMRYEKKYTLEQVGKFYGVTRERVRQIETKELYRLSNNRSFMNCIFYGKDYVDLSADVEQLKAEIGLEKAKLARELCSIKTNGITKEEAEIINGKTLALRIEDSDVSTRTYHCFYRMGIETFNDLVIWLGYNKTRNEVFNELIMVRNLGRKSAYEIIDKLEELGYVFRQN